MYKTKDVWPLTYTETLILYNMGGGYYFMIFQLK